MDIDKKKEDVKRELFDLLVEMGETLYNVDKVLKEEYIISGGLRFSRTYNNSKYTYHVEDCVSNSDYVYINNLFILTLIKDYLFKLREALKHKRRTKPILETEEMTNLLAYKNVTKNHAIFRQRKNKNTKRNKE
ncbi:MAG: hypothetical protein EOM21_19795 [Gammaproteobacteria bacterium]|nr:hypothetical protein [Gammaproteobacteria bacterium]